MRGFKKFQKKAIFILIFITVITGFIIYRNSRNDYITKVLSSSSYSYLSQDVKEIIKKEYENNGTLILTEKNKVDGEPYLNPAYINYIDMDSEQRNEVEVVPNMYVTDVTYSDSNTTNVDGAIPSKYDLRDVDGNNYITELKDQGNTGLCWAFTSIETAETKSMLLTKTPYSSSDQNLSVRQLDYALSMDGLTVLDRKSSKTRVFSNPNNAVKTITNGGNFVSASFAMSNGISLTKESVAPWNENTNTYDVSQILNYSNSLYEVDSTIEVPEITTYVATSDEIDAFVSKVKSYMMQYGAAYFGTVSPMSYCGYKNIDGTYASTSNACYSVSTSMGHALQLIGWDDDYEYSYCYTDASKLNSAVSSDGTCSSGVLKSGKGAWILRNSWGSNTSYKYFYETYDSTNVIVSFIKDMEYMEDRTWDNNYHTVPLSPVDGFGYSLSSSDTQSFVTNNNSGEKVEKIKFYSYEEKNSKYTLKITSGGKKYTITNEVVPYKGIYTFDLSDRDIILNDSNFQVELSTSNGRFMKDSISVFTSNVEEDEKSVTYSLNGYDGTSPLSVDNPLYIDASSSDDWTLTLTSYIKNLPEYSDLTYKINYNNMVVTLEENEKYLYSNYVEATFIGSQLTKIGFDIKQLYGKTFDIEVLYNDKIIETFPVKISGGGVNTTSTVRFYANNGTENYYETTMEDKVSTDLKLSVFNSKEFYNNGYYISSWNTEADGSGTTYAVTNEVIYKNTVLYAIWSKNKIEMTLNFICNYPTKCSGDMESVTGSVGELITLPTNQFTRSDNYGFLYWTIEENTNSMYYEDESVLIDPSILNYPVFNYISFNVYSVWSNNYKTISFDSNKGSGTMKSINVEVNDSDGTLKANVIKSNQFTRKGYTFVGWNTSSEGDGDSYKEQGTIKTDKDVTLYAQWEAITHTITFNSNYDNTQKTQIVNDNEEDTLNKDVFVREGYTFKEWNTASNGKGISYAEGASVNLEEDLNLFAIWVVNQYTITFNSNNGFGSLGDIIGNYDSKVTLPSNTFTRDGYTFREWNTSSEGDGESYLEGANITIKGDLKLYAIWKKNDPFKINNYKYDEIKNYVSKISEGTTLSKYLNNFVIDSSYSLEVETKKQNNNNIIYTGSKSKLYFNKTLELEMTNIVSGDANGDGLINSADLLKVRQHLLNSKLLTDEYFIAADINEDNLINSLDLLRVRQHLLGTKKIS